MGFSILILTIVVVLIIIANSNNKVPEQAAVPWELPPVGSIISYRWGAGDDNARISVNRTITVVKHLSGTQMLVKGTKGYRIMTFQHYSWLVKDNGTSIEYDTPIPIDPLYDCLPKFPQEGTVMEFYEDRSNQDFCFLVGYSSDSYIIVENLKGEEFLIDSSWPDLLCRHSFILRHPTPEEQWPSINPDEDEIMPEIEDANLIDGLFPKTINKQSNL